MTLQAAVEELARIRLERDARTQALKELEEEAKNTALGRVIAEAHEGLTRVREGINELEGAVRYAALEAFDATGNKRPAPGIVIKQYESVEYDPEEAKAWCVEAYPVALRLDKRAFDKVAKILQPEFVTVTPVHKPTIATDLSGALAKARKEEGNGEDDT